MTDNGFQFANCNEMMDILLLSTLKEGIKLAEIKSVFFDNKYTIMLEIAENENVTQRELSRKLGVSVSTVNMLINKMIKEGLIKMNQVSQKQVLYMLTPVGMVEKAKKTVRYLKIHYRAIYSTKEIIKSVLSELDKEHDAIFVLISNDEMGEIIGLAVAEFQSHQKESKIILIHNKKQLDINSFKSPALLFIAEDEDVLEELSDNVNVKMLNLSEKL